MEVDMPTSKQVNVKRKHRKRQERLKAIRREQSAAKKK
jgi:hypothetical protein